MRSIIASVSARVRVFSALRYRNFRLYWFGQLVTVSGLQMIILAEGWLIWMLRGSEFLLGAVGGIRAVPAVLLSLFGGAVADKVELRRFLILIESVACVALFILATLTVSGLVEIWHIFAVAFTFGIIQAFDQPGRHALFPHLLDRQELMNAVSLNSTIWPATKVFGPALGGYIIAALGGVSDSPLLGAGTVFYIASLGFAFFILVLFVLRIPAFQRSPGRNILSEIGDGLKFAWSQSPFNFLIVINFLGIFLVSTHATLLPVFASEVLKGDASTLGTLHAAGGIGSLVGALIAANLGSFKGIGWLIVGGLVTQALFVILFGFSSILTLSLVLQLLAGLSHALFMVAAQSTVQSQVPDHLRGRMMAIWGMNYGVVFPLGQIQMGATASFSRFYLSSALGRYAGAPFTVILGGMIMLVVSLLGIGKIRNLGPVELGPTTGPQRTENQTDH